MTQKSLLQKAKKTATEIVNNRYVRGVSKFAAKLLETTSLITSKNKLSYIAAGLSVFDNAIDAFEIPMHDKAKSYADAEGLDEHFTNLAKIVITSGIAKGFDQETVVFDKEGELCLKRIKFSFGSLYYRMYTDEPSTQAGHNIAHYFYTSAGFDFDQLFDLMWAEFGQGIFLTVANVADDNNAHDVISNIRLHKMKTDEMLYIGNSPNLESFQKEIEKYRNKGISRSYMLIGEPGTGKSSFAVAATKPFTNKILKIDPSVTSNFGLEEIDFVLQNLRPEVVVLDDFDTDNSPKKMLFVLEMIKQYFPNVIIFATVNDFNALTPAIVRPGRIDKRIWFDLPDDDSRKQLAEYYLQAHNVVYDEDQLNQLVIGTEGMSPVYIKDLCVRIHAEETWDVLEDVLVEYRRTIDSIQEDTDEFDS
jgi:hypothetical protein